MFGKDSTNLAYMQNNWLKLSIIALGLSGIFSIFVVLLRLPFFLGTIPNIFDISLVIHVNLSVNVWMLGMTLCITSPHNRIRYPYYFCLFGTVLIFFSGFITGTQAIKNNYIPVLDNLVYIIGLSTFLFGIASQSIITLFFNSKKSAFDKLTHLILLTAFLCIPLAYSNMPTNISLYQFYEYLFWGCGHLLQFVYCQTLICVLCTLQENNKCILPLTVFNAICAIPAPIMYLFYSPESQTLINFFTYHMRILGGISPALCILYLFGRGIDKPYNLFFLLSSGLFVYGGLIGFLIKESNVTIPAHYHGSIVGVTVAFMGMAYKLTDSLSKRASSIQILMYSLGQFLHITGLLLMGGYSALRKTAGMTGGANPFYKFMFMSGGLLSIIGGATFILIMCIYFFKNRANNS